MKPIYFIIFLGLILMDIINFLENFIGNIIGIITNQLTFWTKKIATPKIYIIVIYKNLHAIPDYYRVSQKKVAITLKIRDFWVTWIKN